jgi:hypothetical protein
MRDGMKYLVQRLRGMCMAGTADAAVPGGEIFWTDDHIQTALDLTRREWVREQLRSEPVQVSAGSVEYHDYYFCKKNVEREDSGTAAWLLHDSTGAVVAGSVYSVEYDAGRINFPANTLGTAYYLNYRSYNMEAAAADVWEQKAGHYAGQFDIKTDNHDLKRSQKYDHAVKQVEKYRRLAPPKVGELVRTDFNAHG